MSVAAEPPTRSGASHPSRGRCTATPVLFFAARTGLPLRRGTARVRFSLTMSPITRRVLQAVLYEAIAIAVVGPALSFAFDEPQTSTFGLAIVLSTIALTWNYAFNSIFERWESRQIVRGRSFGRRLAHGAGFEGGLVVVLIPAALARYLPSSSIRGQSGAPRVLLGLRHRIHVGVRSSLWTACIDGGESSQGS